MQSAAFCNDETFIYLGLLIQIGLNSNKEIPFMLTPYSSPIICSLSGCPRARKGGLKLTPNKDDKDEQELK